ncbi:sensor histidine kinase [Actinomadura rudentiformis]|uniref:histidine kinase n=1 Tax=Actinomadura rudentiformis TaxID=359158 RepID=A0A6H9YT94_9ACTN|nr:histidine kinase [Actinomadura rudentiformis]KAB2348844.1 histidine kinase [Actinomadura rudentiformis]
MRRTKREWFADAGVTAFAAAVGLLMLAASLDSFPDDKKNAIIPDIAVGAVGCVLLLLFRRTRPATLAVVLMIIQISASTAYGPAALAVWTVAVRCSWRVTALVAGANLSIIASVFALAPISPSEYRDGLVTFGLGYAVLITLGLLVRSQSELIKSLRERAQETEEGQRLRVEEARLLERERIAREMHDVLAHRISLLSVHAGALEFGPDAPAAQREAAGIIRQTAYEAMEDLREVIGVLRADAPFTTDGAQTVSERDRPQPTLTDLPALIDESREAGAHVILDARIPDPAAIPARIGRHAYRVVQEGLTNARKHAPGSHVRVTVEAAGGAELTIEVANRLLPALAALDLPGSGAGLVGLRERVDLVGGTIEHGRTGDEFRLRVSLPLPARPGHEAGPDQ